jgi:vacuolar-type H+-ATPase subunit I/STV1
MFGKPRDLDDTLDSSAIDGFFGDESAAETIVEVHELQHRVEQVEAQVNSQFTSLATYAQIAQEQVELARSEAKAAVERSEQRMTSLIERERADRLASSPGAAPAMTSGSVDIEVTDRLNALDVAIDEIRSGLADCLIRQKELAEAITTMFERLASRPVEEPARSVEPVERPVEENLDKLLAEAGIHDFDLPAPDPREFPAPDATTTTGEVPLLPPPTIDVSAIPLSGPIAGLSFDS